MMEAMPLILFLVLFVLLMLGGIAVVGWMVHAVVTKRGMPSS